jgi:hypothetical protein
MTEEKKMKIEFAPGCFDHFEGTQEELDEMIAMIQQAVDSGEIFENSRELTDEDFDELPDEIKAQLMDSLEDIESETPKRTLQ